MPSLKEATAADVRQAQPGVRLILPLVQCHRRTHYERLIHGEQSRVIWRYEFWTVEGGWRIIYSGNWLHGVEPGGGPLWIKATIKTQEPQWGATRVARPIILDRPEIPLPF